MSYQLNYSFNSIHNVYLLLQTIFTTISWPLVDMYTLHVHAFNGVFLYENIAIDIFLQMTQPKRNSSLFSMEP